MRRASSILSIGNLESKIKSDHNKGGFIPPELRSFMLRVGTAWSLMTIILLVSCTATIVFYFMLYWQLMPRTVEMITPLYFDYDNNHLGQLGYRHLQDNSRFDTDIPKPLAMVEFAYADQQWDILVKDKYGRHSSSSAIKYRYGDAEHMSSGFRYDVSVHFVVPDFRVERNPDLGNFMINVTFADKHNRAIAKSKRPVLIAPGLVPRQPRSWFWLPRAIFNWIWPSSEPIYDDRISVEVLCFEQYLEHANSKAHYATVELSSPLVQIFEANLHFRCKLSGIVYYMYHWRISTFLSFAVVCCGIQAIFSYSIVGIFGMASAASMYSDFSNRRTRGRSPTRGVGFVGMEHTSPPQSGAYQRRRSASRSKSRSHSP